MKRMLYFIVVSLLEISPYVSTVACSGSLLAEGIEDYMYSSTMAIGHSYVYGGCKNQHLQFSLYSISYHICMLCYIVEYETDMSVGITFWPPG